MSRVILTKCQNQICNKDFGIDAIRFNLYSVNEFFEVDCPYCKWRNKKRGIKMDKDELLILLKDLNKGEDDEQNHIDADKLLLRYIDDKDISDAFKSIRRYYS